MFEDVEEIPIIVNSRNLESVKPKHIKNVRRPQLTPRLPRAMSDLSDLGAREPRVDQAGALFQDLWR